MTKPKRPDIREVLLADLRKLISDAENFGLVVTVSQVPLQPLAMRNYMTLVEVREVVKRGP